MKLKNIFAILCALTLLICTGCAQNEQSSAQPDKEASSKPSQEQQVEQEQQNPQEEQSATPEVSEEKVIVYENGEITISIPAEYENLVKLDDMGSDEQYAVKANLYYAPAYFEHEAYVASLNGGWMLTVSTTLPSFAAHAAEEPTRETTCGPWSANGDSVYVEVRPTEGNYNCEAAQEEEFKAVFESIEIDYGDLNPFTDEERAKY